MTIVITTAEGETRIIPASTIEADAEDAEDAGTTTTKRPGSTNEVDPVEAFFATTIEALKNGTASVSTTTLTEPLKALGLLELQRVEDRCRTLQRAAAGRYAALSCHRHNAAQECEHWLDSIAAVEAIRVMKRIDVLTAKKYAPGRLDAARRRLSDVIITTARALNTTKKAKAAERRREARRIERYSKALQKLVDLRENKITHVVFRAPTPQPDLKLNPEPQEPTT
jgi:hypothetical protein